jgi:hypothetical protein
VSLLHYDKMRDLISKNNVFDLKTNKISLMFMLLINGVIFLSLLLSIVKSVNFDDKYVTIFSIITFVVYFLFKIDYKFLIFNGLIILGFIPVMNLYSLPILTYLGVAAINLLIVGVVVNLILSDNNLRIKFEQINLFSNVNFILMSVIWALIFVATFFIEISKSIQAICLYFTIIFLLLHLVIKG